MAEAMEDGGRSFEAMTEAMERRAKPFSAVSERVPPKMPSRD